ncbi:MAG: aldehyde dehydrogenase family protein [Verrucomicrobia bacterium]|nr:aldehyde dehydrogenase family protein [Verrucomicrobiota bacterium]
MKVEEILKTMEYGPAPESRAMADEWLDSFNRKFELYVNGKWQKPGGGEYLPAICPADKSQLCEFASATKEDVGKAVAAAKVAQPLWAGLGGHGRARYLYAIARQIQKNSRLFAVLESLDNGKPIRESRDIDVPLAARHFYHHAGWAQLMDSKLSDYEPLGIVGGIVPWNFPFLIFVWKIAPALAAGNTVVLKPAQLTSLSTLAFADMCDQIGLPPGVLNIVTGKGSRAGQAIVDHPDVAKVTFTGSTGVGQGLRQSAAGSGKKLTMELGGKSPFIVFEDADLDSAVEGVVDAIWFNQGQVCCAGSRLLVQESVEDKLIRKIKARMETLRVGHSLDKAVDIGAVVDETQLNTIKKFVEIGRKEGARIWQPSTPVPTTGYYHPPTLCTGVEPSSTIVIEEIFGPVLVSMSFRTPVEAVELANNTRYGLAASVWTENLNLALDIAPKLKAGVVWVNCTNQFDAAAGFGGYRESGYGREGGIEGMYEFVKPRWEREFRKQSFVKRPKTAAKKPADLPEVMLPEIDQTAKMFIAGKQVRPDGGYSVKVRGPGREIVGEVSRGNRKDIRNAVESAHTAHKWQSGMHGHGRAQVLFYIAENLSRRDDEFAARIMHMTGADAKSAQKEVALSIERIYYYAAWADKYDGHVHHIPMRGVAMAMPEPIGVMGIVCPNDFPLLGFVSTVMPALARGNQIIAIPSEPYPLSATDFYQIFETSDLPPGAVNIITGSHAELTEILAKHDGVDGIWYFSSKDLSKMIEFEASVNMKRTWLNYGKYRDWANPVHGQSEEFLRKATEIKNIWVPYGEQAF